MSEFNPRKVKRLALDNTFIVDEMSAGEMTFEENRGAKLGASMSGSFYSIVLLQNFSSKREKGIFGRSY